MDHPAAAENEPAMIEQDLEGEHCVSVKTNEIDSIPWSNVFGRRSDRVVDVQQFARCRGQRAQRVAENPGRRDAGWCVACHRSLRR